MKRSLSVAVFLALGLHHQAKVLGQPAAAGPVAPYNVNAPAYPVVYTDADKETQRSSARAQIKAANQAIADGKTDYTIPPGIYRIPKDGPDHDFDIDHLKKDVQFALKVAGCEFVLENGGNFLHAGNPVSFAVIGPARFDADPLNLTQAIITSYDEATGHATARILPGYAVELVPTGVIDTYSPAGVYLENPSWAKYAEAEVTDPAGRMVKFTVGSHRPIYQQGNLVTLQLRSSLFLSIRNGRNLTLQDLDIYTSAGLMWGGGNGNWNFVRVRGIPRPGTNRLRGVASCQVRVTGGNITFEGCSFSNNTDDLIDFSGGGIAMNLRQTGPREVIAWRSKIEPGQTVNFYAHADFVPAATARVATAEKITDAALQSEAQEVVQKINKGRWADEKGSFQRLTLDRDVSVAPGDYVEIAGVDGPDHFTVRDCYFSNSGVRVMIQGFQHGLFERNTFERISGGFTTTLDAWWWGGPVSQDVTIRDNLFRHTTFGIGHGTGKAAIAVGAPRASKGPAKGGATHHVSITHNRIEDSSRDAILVNNAADVTVSDNVIVNAQGAKEAGVITLNGVFKGAVTGNTANGLTGPMISVANSSGVQINNNHVDPSAVEIVDSADCIQSNNSPSGEAKKN